MGLLDLDHDVDLGREVARQGRHADALPLARRILAIHRQLVGEEHSQTALGWAEVAFCLLRQGKHAEAQRLYEKALAIRRRVLDRNHPAIAMTCSRGL